MRISRPLCQCGILIAALFFYVPIVANAKKPDKISLPTTLKANKIDGDRLTNVLNATGNVELKKNGNILFADRLTYSKDDGDIQAFGNIKIKNYDLGTLFAEQADIKSDFKSGNFNKATIVFNDGSYIKSPKITRNSEVETIFNLPIFSICPNDEIMQDNLSAGSKPDLISLTSRTTTINKSTNTIKTKNGVLRLYDFPVFYTPYLSTPLPSSERKSGFLFPSYVNGTALGAGFKIPYYFNIAPDKDLTSTLQYHPSGEHILLNNDYRHLLQNGVYGVKLELANNQQKSNNFIGDVSVKNSQNVRWKATSVGEISLPKNLGLDFNINNVGDKNYLREYHNQFFGYTVSQVNLDYIKDRDYASIKTVKIQELEVNLDGKETPFALPILNYYTESKPQGGLFNQTYSALFNTTVINRSNGLQYRRLSVKPAIKIPYNLKGNLFEASASAQGDFYNLENNFTTTPKNNHFKSTAVNYRPEASLKWSMPLVGKYKTNTIIIEPLANLVVSSYKERANNIPNEDGGNTELTRNNLFLSDRFTGFDRNEGGKRMSYGFKSSFFNDKIGQFNFNLGQSWRTKSATQDVVIRGFNDSNKSNIVGGFEYKALKNFNIFYNFQLNESNYRNDINEIGTNLNLGKFDVSNNYIFIRKTINNADQKKQLNFNINYHITDKLLASLNNTYDLLSSRSITKKYGLAYNGCCVTYGFFLSENNPTALAKPQKSYDINFTIKNL